MATRTKNRNRTRANERNLTHHRVVASSSEVTMRAFPIAFARNDRTRAVRRAFFVAFPRVFAGRTVYGMCPSMYSSR